MQSGRKLRIGIEDSNEREAGGRILGWLLAIGAGGWNFDLEMLKTRNNERDGS